MFALGAILAIASGLGWASADVLRKHLTTDARPLRLSIQLASTQLVIVLVVASCLLIPLGVDGWSTWRLADTYWHFALPSFLCTAAGHLLFLEALKSSELSFTIPFLSFSPIFVMGLAILLLGEWPSLLACLGVLIVALGTVVLEGVQARKKGGPLPPDAQRKYRRGRNLMLMTAACWSLAAALDKGAIQQSNSLTHLILLLGSTWCLLAIYERVIGHASMHRGRKDTGWFGKDWQRRWITCLVMVVSMALQFAAYRYWEVAYVESIKRALGLMCSVAFGAFIFREKRAVHRLPAVIAMALGTVLVILG